MPTSVTSLVPLPRPVRRVLLAVVVAGVASMAAPAWADALLANQESNAQPSEVVETRSSSELTQLLQDLAPLPVIALGLLGLFWIRKHTADL